MSDHEPTPIHLTIDNQLSKREKIAAMCLQGILSYPDYRQCTQDRVLMAIENADELLKQLRRRTE